MLAVVERAGWALGVGGLLLGVVIGTALARRGRRLHVDWRLRVDTDPEPPPKALPPPTDEP